MPFARSTRSIAAVILLTLAPLTALATGQVGEAGADFSLVDTNGMTHTMSDHLGEVLYLWLIGYS